MSFILLLLVVIIAMAVRDFLGTLMVIAEADGDGHAAGLADAIGDWANLAWMAIGIDTLITSGLSIKTGIMLVVIFVTSYWTTRLTVEWRKHDRISD